jgi:hypothetical protein
MDAFMGRAMPRTEVTRRLLRGNLRPQEVGSGSGQALSLAHAEHWIFCAAVPSSKRLTASNW